MPELPEVEIIRRDLDKEVVGKRIRTAEVRNTRNAMRVIRRHGRRREFEEPLTGARIEAVGRRGKFLMLALSSGNVLVIHLGMAGQLLLVKASAGGGGPEDRARSSAVRAPAAFPCRSLTQPSPIPACAARSPVRPRASAVAPTPLAKALRLSFGIWSSAPDFWRRSSKRAAVGRPGHATATNGGKPSWLPLPPGAVQGHVGSRAVCANRVAHS